MEGRTVMSDLEEEGFVAYSTWHSSDDEAAENMEAVLRNITKIRKERIALQTRLRLGGRKRYRAKFSHAFYEWVIRADMYGQPAFTDANGVEHPSQPAHDSEYQFNTRFRVGPKRFAQLLYELQDPVSGNEEFRTKTDAAGKKGASPL